MEIVDWQQQTNHMSQATTRTLALSSFSVSERERERRKDIKTAVHNEKEEESKQLTRSWRRQEVWSIVGFIKDIDFCTRWKRCECLAFLQENIYDLSLVLSRFGDAADDEKESG